MAAKARAVAITVCGRKQSTPPMRTWRQIYMIALGSEAMARDFSVLYRYLSYMGYFEP